MHSHISRGGSAGAGRKPAMTGAPGAGPYRRASPSWGHGYDMVGQEKRIGVVALAIHDRQARAASVNSVISQYADLVVGRMGVPYRERGLSIIALLVDGSTDALGAMTGKLGNIPGVKVRSVLLTAAGQELSPKEDS